MTVQRLTTLAILGSLLWTTSTTCAEPSTPAAGPETGAVAERNRAAEVRRLVAAFRRYRDDPARRAEAVAQLARTDPKSVTGVAEAFDKELQRFSEQLDAPLNREAESQIARLRKVLADLRASEPLTKEMIEQVGLPALDGLTAVYKVYQPEVERHYQQLLHIRDQLGLSAEFLRKLPSFFNSPKSPLPRDKTIERVEALLARTAMPERDAIAAVRTENAKIYGQLAPDLAAGMTAVNDMRIMCGLNALLVDLRLCQAARDHSVDMHKHEFFAHESPVPGKKTPWDRAKRFGTTASGENIYMGRTSPVSAIKGWFLSPGHHKNMLGEHQRQGLGRDGKYWTQLFGK